MNSLDKTGLKKKNLRSLRKEESQRSRRVAFQSSLEKTMREQAPMAGSGPLEERGKKTGYPNFA